MPYATDRHATYVNTVEDERIVEKYCVEHNPLSFVCWDDMVMLLSRTRILGLSTSLVIRLPITIKTSRAMATSAASDENLKISKLFDMSHVTAVVTGGGTGIGLMVAQALASNGAKVYITDLRKEALESVVSQYNEGPGEIIALPGDITQKDDLRRLANEVVSKESKGIHLLVNNGKLKQLFRFLKYPTITMQPPTASRVALNPADRRLLSHSYSLLFASL